MQLFNARTQQLEDVKWSVDLNREIVANFADGTFIKFPADTDKKTLAKLINDHQQANEGQEVISPEVLAEQAAQLEAAQVLVTDLNGNTSQSEDKTDASATTDTKANS